MVEVKLFKKEGTYVNKENKEKRFVNFYVKCGDKLIPFDVKYFPNKKCDGRDPEYAGRMEVLRAFAEPLTDKKPDGE